MASIVTCAQTLWKIEGVVLKTACMQMHGDLPPISHLRDAIAWNCRHSSHSYTTFFLTSDSHSDRSGFRHQSFYSHPALKKDVPQLLFDHTFNKIPTSIFETIPRAELTRFDCSDGKNVVLLLTCGTSTLFLNKPISDLEIPLVCFALALNASHGPQSAS